MEKGTQVRIKKEASKAYGGRTGRVVEYRPQTEGTAQAEVVVALDFTYIACWIDEVEEVK